MFFSRKGGFSYQALTTEWPLKSKLDPEVYGPPESAITTEIIQQVIGCFISVEQDLSLTNVDKRKQVDMDKDKSEEAETNVDSSTKRSKLFKSQTNVNRIQRRSLRQSLHQREIIQNAILAKKERVWRYHVEGNLRGSSPRDEETHPLLKVHGILLNIFGRHPWDPLFIIDKRDNDGITSGGRDGRFEQGGSDTLTLETDNILYKRSDVSPAGKDVSEEDYASLHGNTNKKHPSQEGSLSSLSEIVMPTKHHAIMMGPLALAGHLNVSRWQLIRRMCLLPGCVDVSVIHWREQGAGDSRVFHSIASMSVLNGKSSSSNIPKTVDEMMRRVDEFVRAEEAYARTELPPGESRDIHRRLSFPTGPRDVHQRLTFPTSTRNDRDNRSSQRRGNTGK
ncbi:reverse transcriptase domain-containing protein [Tanacetum coccineum]